MSVIALSWQDAFVPQPDGGIARLLRRQRRAGAGRLCVSAGSAVAQQAMDPLGEQVGIEAAGARDAAQGVSDEALLVAFGNGDLAAARLLTDRLGPRILRYATRVLAGDHAEAEDVTQEAMLRLWRAAPEWRQGEARVQPWLYRVATNLCIDRLRRARRNGPALHLIADPVDPTPAPAELLAAAARAAALDTALAALPERQRQAVVLRHIEGLGNPEIADIMDIGVEAVESLIARGKRGLKAALAGRREELGYGE